MKKVLGFIVALGLLFVVAACVPTTVTISFETGEGSALEDVRIGGGQLLEEPTGSVYLGYVISGWYTDEALTDEFDFANDKVMSNMVLYANWVPDHVTFAGVEDEEVEFQGTFNVLDGVTATGTTGIDYTSYITFSSIGEIDELGNVDTNLPGSNLIQYEVKIGSLILGQKFRTITIASLQQQEGEMLVNADFTLGVAGWDTFVDNGATIALSTEEFEGNPALKVDVHAGPNAWEPRFTQMNVPFEEDITYEISFRAKSSVEKTINLQVGEILTVSPWFTDFKTGLTIHKTITTDWATHSFKFTMNQGDENLRGGILFELGTVDGNTVDATMWFDDISIVESTPDADETAPLFSGLVAERTVLLDGTFDPMNGVTAFDVVDGDVTEDIVLVIKDDQEAVVSAIDTSVDGAVYTLTYTVSDAVGNEAEFVVTLTVVGMQFESTNLIVNGEFESEMSDPAEWISWTQDWGSVPVVVHTLNDTEGVYTVNITGGGDAAWSVQLYQDGITLVEGNTYRILLTAKAEVARTINVAIGVQDGENFDQYARFDSIQLETDYTTQAFVFTVTKATSNQIKINFELGSSAGFADGLVTFDTIAVHEAILDPLIENGTFEDGWTLWYQDWDVAPVVSYNRDGGTFNITTDSGGQDVWAIQFNQMVDLAYDTTYVFTFDAMASVARDINVKLFTANYDFFVSELNHMLTTSMTTHSIEFTTPSTGQIEDLTLSFEMGATTAFAAGTVSLDNISLKEKDVADAPEIIVNGDATSVPGFVFFDENGNSMVLGNNGAVISLVALGSAAYQPHVYQMLVEGLSAGNYVLKLVVSADVVRDLRANLVVPDWGYISLLPDTFYDYQTVADGQVVVNIPFTLNNDVTVAIKLELDFGTIGGEFTSTLGTFTIEEVLLYQDFN